MFSGHHSIRKLEDGSVFIDRDGTYFRIILNYLRGNILSIADLPNDAPTLSDLFKEVNYYQLTALQDIIKPRKNTVDEQNRRGTKYNDAIFLETFPGYASNPTKTKR